MNKKERKLEKKRRRHLIKLAFSLKKKTIWLNELINWLKKEAMIH